MALVRTNVSEEHVSVIIMVKRIGELGTTLAVTNSRSTLRRNDGGDTFLQNAGSDKNHAASEDSILHSHLSENLKSDIALIGWALYRSCNVSPVRYVLGFYIPEDDILHSHRRENLKFYIALTDWAL
jgi:hypothetical protein